MNKVKVGIIGAGFIVESNHLRKAVEIKTRLKSITN
jgi:predicted dehydrogenase